MEQTNLQSQHSRGLGIWVSVVLWAALGSGIARAEIRVGFFAALKEGVDATAISHVALQWHGRWFHSHPRGGVQLSTAEEMNQEFGLVLLHVRVDPRARALGPGDVMPYLGVPYDDRFVWGGDKIYCSELVGRILGLRPVAMTFSGPQWIPYFAKFGLSPPYGAPGLSPDEVDRQLKSRGFAHEACDVSLR